MNQPALVARNVTKVFRPSRTAPPVVAVSGVNLEIPRATFVAVSGPSGSGKSTLLNLLGCIDSPTSGSVVALGMNVRSASQARLAEFRLHHVGLVFQRFNLVEHLTALENVALPLQYLHRRPPARERRRRAETALAAVGLSHRLNHHPSQLSGGEQQRVGVARALVNNPELVLADEPTGELDRVTGNELIELLMALRRDRGATMVIVTHDPNLAARADRHVQLIDGRIASMG